MASAKRERPHARVYEDELESAAWRSLSTDAFALLVWLRAKGRPSTNGKEKVTVRQIKGWLHVGHGRAMQAMNELEDRGLIRWTGERKKGQARTFRRTDAKAEGIAATREFLSWQPSSSLMKGQRQSVVTGMSHRSDAPARDPSELRKVH